MTTREYDVNQLRQFLIQVGLGMAVCGLLHFKWDIVAPLFIQTAMAPFTLYDNPLFKIHVLSKPATEGSPLGRPFPVPELNPLASLLGAQGSASAPTQAPASEEATTTNKEHEKPKNTKTGKGKKTQAEEEESKKDQ